MHLRTTTPRTGFTLVEMLTVIAILAVLVALTGSAVVGTVNWQHRSNTKSELDKLHGEVDKQRKAARDDYSKTTPPTSVLLLAQGDPARAKVIWEKLCYKQQFPMSYDEAVHPDGGIIPPRDLPSRYPELRDPITGQARPSGNVEAESAACLLLALKKKRRGTGFDVEEALGSAFIKDTDQDGVPEIVDSWGTPIKFYRWGTNHPDLAAAGDPSARPLGRDPEDPMSTLMNAGWNGNAQSAAAFQNLCHPIRDNYGAGTLPYSYYTEPTIVSAGPNRKFGLTGANMTPSPGADEADNLYSFKLR